MQQAQEQRSILDHDDRVDLIAHIFNSKNDDFPVRLLAMALDKSEESLRDDIAACWGPVPGTYTGSRLEWQKAYSLLYDHTPITTLDEVFAEVTGQSSRLHPSRRTEEVKIYLPAFVLQAVEESGVDLNQLIFDALVHGNEGVVQRALELLEETNPENGGVA